MDAVGEKFDAEVSSGVGINFRFNTLATFSILTCSMVQDII
jgi:hypothetical protein